jgi:hypothetical protein
VSQEQPRAFRYDLVQDYLEVARAALTQIHGKVPVSEQDSAPPLSDDVANASFCVMSMTIVYSFLALEACLNYQLFQIWSRRQDGTPEANRFLSVLGDAAAFEKLKTHARVRELPSRLRTLCDLLGYRQPHEAIPDTWRRLNDLVEASRHFVVHPFPDAEYFSANMRRVMTQTTAGSYVRVVEEILQFLYQSSSAVAPAWVTQNQLIRFRGIDLLPIQRRA